MADVFLSYSSQDKLRVQALVNLLQKNGWTVWWDREIPPGKAFDDVIQAAMEQARCVVVVWSSASISSDWVKTEAATARKRGVLIPLKIDEVEPPFEFSRLQAADLVGFPSREVPEQIAKLLATLSSIVGTPPTLSTITQEGSALAPKKGLLRRSIERFAVANHRQKIVWSGLATWLLVSVLSLFLSVEEINLLFVVPATTVLLASFGFFTAGQTLKIVILLHGINISLLLTRVGLTTGDFSHVAWLRILFPVVANALIVVGLAVRNRPGTGT